MSLVSIFKIVNFEVFIFHARGSSTFFLHLLHSGLSSLIYDNNNNYNKKSLICFYSLSLSEF